MQYLVAVRTLCEFTAKTGDLDLRFTPSPSAQEGIAGHQAVTARRRASYESEVTLQGQYRHLQVRGRADGFDAQAGRLEEIKTHRGDLARQPGNHRALHWAQAKVYGALLCQARGLGAITLALVYYDIASQRETVIEEQHEAAALQQFFETLCTRFLDWAAQELAHRQARDAALATLAFPHPQFRPGQRDLAQAVYRGAVAGRCLLAQAPTGIGKTVATLFPLLKACPGKALDKVVYLAAKTPGRQLAIDALQQIGAAAPAGLPLRVLELTARDKACEHPDKACHGQSCPLARGFYDRLPQARATALQRTRMDRATLREEALAHQVCPYYLAQELVRWADVVVGDYNYWFDASALLHALAVDQGWRVALLADEAHNLVERARAMYSAQLDPAALRAARGQAPAALRKHFDRVRRQWAALDSEHAYVVHPELPERFVFALQQLSAAIAEHLADAPAVPEPALQQCHFDLLAFTRLAESFGSHSLFDVTMRPARGGGAADALPCIRNLIPAPFLAPRFATAHSATLFSATLSPRSFYQDTLGLPPDTAWIDVDSPFEASQLAVHLVPQISTRFGDRARSAAPIADLIARQYHAQPGNYLAFFSSFDYLQLVAGCFGALHAGITQWSQSRGMAEPDRQAFLARFAPGGQGVGFAVLGGPFAEGIDLPGDRLVGAFVATLGLPQLNPVNEQLKDRMGQAFGADHGYDYAYLYPGLQKVVQAAGRVIRTPQDRGVLYLIDDRFARPAVRKLLPAWWGVQSPN
jgi:Rad3-related DNA helicase